MFEIAKLSYVPKNPATLPFKWTSMVVVEFNEDQKNKDCRIPKADVMAQYSLVYQDQHPPSTLISVVGCVPN